MVEKSSTLLSKLITHGTEIQYLGVVATSVPSERLFSTAGNIVTAKRCALEPENVEKLVFLHDNLPAIQHQLSYQQLHLNK